MGGNGEKYKRGVLPTPHLTRQSQLRLRQRAGGWGARRLSVRPFSEACLCCWVESLLSQLGFLAWGLQRRPEFQNLLQSLLCPVSSFVPCVGTTAERKAFRGSPDSRGPSFLIVRSHLCCEAVETAPGQGRQPCGSNAPGFPPLARPGPAAPQGRCVCLLAQVTDTEMEAQAGEFTPRSILQLGSGGLTIQTSRPRRPWSDPTQGGLPEFVSGCVRVICVGPTGLSGARFHTGAQGSFPGGRSTTAGEERT